MFSTAQNGFLSCLKESMVGRDVLVIKKYDSFKFILLIIFKTFKN